MANFMSKAEIILSVGIAVTDLTILFGGGLWMYFGTLG